MPSRENKILITGCSRSGTGYVSKVLSALGLDVGHETMGADGIVSWGLAVDTPVPFPWGDGTRLADHRFAPILHQVRHPLPTLLSLQTVHPQSWIYVRRCLGRRRFPVVGRTVLHVAMSYYHHWNLRAETLADWTYRLEDLPHCFETFCRKLGRPELAECKEMLSQVSNRVNSRAGTYEEYRWTAACVYEEVGWADLGAEDPLLAEAIRHQALRYGYGDIAERAPADRTPAAPTKEPRPRAHETPS